MPTLSTELRNKLERTITGARDIAEAGATAVLETLAVHHHEPYGHMSTDQRRLRNHLRARARQLGDRQNRKGELEIDRLARDCAYEHWHRMLFARFLAENDLLMEPKMGVAVTLKECEELAREAGTDPWTLASRYAQQMLPQIFRPDDPLLRIAFAREHQLKLEKLLDWLENTVFTASDALGWVYQFWQTRRKKEVNKSGVKIGADELPAVTQLFTEDYMVDFMLDNTLGAWWTARHPDERPPHEIKYLRFKDDGTPAAGTFDGWPDRAADLKCIDPSCGSGHFLVALFERLVPIRMAEEELSASEAARAVLHDNLYGLEIDPRCTQLAAFALALAAWKLDPSLVSEKIPPLNIACCGLEIAASRDEWKDLGAGRNFLMNQFYDLFRNAGTLGSLIDPARQVRTMPGGDDVGDLEETILRGLERYRVDRDFEQTELGVNAKGLTDAYRLLRGRYHLVATNVPYLTRGKQAETLKKFIESHYPLGKQDLATAFVERCMGFCTDGGTATLVTPQNWLFLGSYTKLRMNLLKMKQWDWVVRLGTKAFRTPMWDFNIMLISLTNRQPAELHEMAGLDASDEKTPQQKAEVLLGRIKQNESQSDTEKESNKRLRFVSQKSQLDNPDARVTFLIHDNIILIREVAESYQGIVTGDIERFTKCYWEIRADGSTWVPYRRSNNSDHFYGDVSVALFWESGKGSLQDYAKLARTQLHDMHESGNRAWGKIGVAINRMRDLRAVPYYGEHFDNNVAVIISKFRTDITRALLACIESNTFPKEIRDIDQALKVTNKTLLKVPFDLEYWQKVADEKYPDGLPEPYSNDPTQWIFKGLVTDTTASLHVAAARLMGYRWPEQEDDGLDELSDDDGIVCIPSVRGEDTAAGRLHAVLAKAFGEAWTAAKEKELLASTGSKSSGLDDWLRNHFFEQHCKLFHHRPFIWHVWDGRKRDGFHALVNYHKLAEGGGKGRKVLESLTYSYLGDWIARQKDGVRRGAGGAEDRIAAATELQNRLVAILEGEPPFDIFVRWKPIEKQAIGWEPDINDGVRLNIRPFMTSDVPGGKKGAGILRWKPNVKWGKDRGTEPKRPREQYPWFWENGKFTGNRVNDIHLTNNEKHGARGNSHD